MDRCTDMEKIHELMERYLNMEVEITSSGYAKHPYRLLLWQANDALFGKSDSEVSSKPGGNKTDAYSFVQDQVKMEKIRAEVKKRLFKMSVKDIYSAIEDTFLFSFLKEAKDFLSSDDLSTIIGPWLRHASGEPTEYDIVSKEDFCELLKACNRQILMDKHEYEYYQKCISGLKVEVFRGTDNYGDDFEPTDFFFWNEYPEDIAKYYDEFWGGHAGYRAMIDASDIFMAHFNTGGLLVVNPDKLLDIEDYSEFDDAYEEVCEEEGDKYRRRDD